MEQTKYEILMVDYEATPEEIKSNYRKLVKILHPDVNKNTTVATKQLQELTTAYATLHDETKRKAYDLTLTAEDRHRIRKKYQQYHERKVSTDQNQKENPTQ